MFVRGLRCFHFLVTDMHIQAIDIHISQMLIGLTAIEKFFPGKLHPIHNRISKKDISPPTRRF
jgi:hypothetical protein